MEKCMGKCDEAKKVSAGTLEFTIPGEPMAKQRPRMTKEGITYTPKKTVSYENLVKEMYYSRYAGVMLEGEIELVVRAYMKVPKSVSKKKREAMLKGEIRPTKKPDWDNVGKIVADSLNNIAYDDDSQIVRAVVEKYYSDLPRVEVELRRLGT